MNCKLTEETLGQRIKAQRIRMNMTQDELAEEKDPILETICSIYNRIEDDRVKELLHLQIQVAEKVMR